MIENNSCDYLHGIKKHFKRLEKMFFFMFLTTLLVLFDLK